MFFIEGIIPVSAVTVLLLIGVFLTVIKLDQENKSLPT
jgi:hypothetical protein